MEGSWDVTVSESVLSHLIIISGSVSLLRKAHVCVLFIEEQTEPLRMKTSVFLT